MEVVLFSVGFVLTFVLVTVLPISICLKVARERGIDSLIGLFVGLLFSWIGVIVFVPAAARHHRSLAAAGAAGRFPASEQTPPIAVQRRPRSHAEHRQPVAPGARGR